MSVHNIGNHPLSPYFSKAVPAPRSSGLENIPRRTSFWEDALTLSTGTRLKNKYPKLTWKTEAPSPLTVERQLKVLHSQTLYIHPQVQHKMDTHTGQEMRMAIKLEETLEKAVSLDINGMDILSRSLCIRVDENGEMHGNMLILARDKVEEDFPSRINTPYFIEGTLEPESGIFKFRYKNNALQSNLLITSGGAVIDLTTGHITEME